MMKCPYCKGMTPFMYDDISLITREGSYHPPEYILNWNTGEEELIKHGYTEEIRDETITPKLTYCHVCKNKLQISVFKMSLVILSIVRKALLLLILLLFYGISVLVELGLLLFLLYKIISTGDYLLVFLLSAGVLFLLNKYVSIALVDAVRAYISSFRIWKYNRYTKQQQWN